MTPFPRVTVPGVEPMPADLRLAIETAAEEERDQAAHVRAQKKGLAQAMLRLGKPIFRGVAKPARTPSRHARQRQRAQARSAWLREALG